MDSINSLTAELYFWGHFDILQNAAENYAKKGKVDYQSILEEQVEHHLRSSLRQLPLHQSLKEAVKEWFDTSNFVLKDSPDWKSWGFPEEKEIKKGKKEYLLPVMHLCKLAVDAFDITSDGRLCRPYEDDIDRFTRFGCVPPTLLGATRYAMKKGLRWDAKNITITSEAATQEFQVLIQRGLADAHVHLTGATTFADLLYVAIRGIKPPRSLNGGDFIENGTTHGEHDFPFHHLAVRPLLLACKAMMAAILSHARKPNKTFKEFLDETIKEGDKDENNEERKTIDTTLSRRFWKLAYFAAKSGGNFTWQFDSSVADILKKAGNYKQFFKQGASFEKHWFTIVRHVLESQNDKELCYHFTQLTRCICCLYRPMFHREGFYEFDRLFEYLDILTDAAGNPAGRQPRRIVQADPLKRIGYDSMQKHCKYLRKLQLRTTIRATRKRLPRRRPRKNGREPLLTRRRLEVELQNHLATYKKYIEEQSVNCHFCGQELKDKCPHCGKVLSAGKVMMITFPIHFVRGDQKERGDESRQRKTLFFRLLWHRMELLASLLLKNPALRYFFGRIDVANNEDLKPNWIFALVFQELESRLKKMTALNSGMAIPRMRYNCHAGEHFTSSIQGLRRIWEPVEFFPHLDAIGHAFALGVTNRFPSEMPANELLDDLVWLLLHRDHIHNIPLEIIERIGIEIADKIYGTKCDKKDKPIDEILFRDLKDAYHWRFDREKVAKYIGVLSHHRKTGEFRYKPYFNLPKDENKKFPKAAKILQKYFSKKEVARPYKLSPELRETLEKCYPFLRNFVMQKIVQKNIIVEVCPASNFRIGSLARLEDHPLFAMCPPDQNGGISTVFGTDDPAMFQTSIDDEYLFVKEAMDKKYPDLPQEKQLEYLETIRCRSMELCCDELPDDIPAILRIIDKAGVK